jgi:hypothetical protein
MKAKAKAERAAARHAQQTQLYALVGGSTPSSATATPGPASETATPTPADSPHEADEPPPTSKESPPDRTEMLRGKPEVVGRFMQLIVPILVDVYAASVITTVRIKTLTGLLKAISYLEADGIKRVLTVSWGHLGFLMQEIDHGVFLLVCTDCELCVIYPLVQRPLDPRYWRFAARRAPPCQNPGRVPTGLPEGGSFPRSRAACRPTASLLEEEGQ